MRAAAAADSPASVMLSESFLCTAVYRELMSVEDQKDREEAASAWSRGARSAAEADHRERGAEPRYQGDPSGALSIPRRRARSDASLDLYTSWSGRYGSLYKNYPDLHIAGDHILTKVDSGCILDGEDGPVLLSADIDSSSSPPKLSPEGPLEGAGAPSVESHVLPSAPFSNSVLNGFLENKMQELYKQCYEERLSPGASPRALLCSAIMHSVQHISLQHCKAKEAVLQCLCCATGGGSSEFITPTLHISGQDSRTKPGALVSKK